MGKDQVQIYSVLGLGFRVWCMVKIVLGFIGYWNLGFGPRILRGEFPWL